MREIRMLELFSGIGGMHMAATLAAKMLEGQGANLTVVAAMDINTVANEVYRHNWPTTKSMQKNILGLTVPELESLNVNLVTMSPPCQPHTRQGNKKDIADNRSGALAHLVTVLPLVSSVEYILLENVCGFEESEARGEVMEALAAKGFTWQEFLISPRQINIPNSRLRYYLLAKRNSLTWEFRLGDNLRTDLSDLDSFLLRVHEHLPTGSKIQDYIDSEVSEDFLVPDNILSKYSHVLDLVNKESDKSCCFTSGYSRYCEGTGSVLQTAGDAADVYQRANKEESVEDTVTILKELKLRYFTPSEICRLLCFANHFNFPSNITKKQQYKVLGNSINVKVVVLMIYLLLS